MLDRFTYLKLGLSAVLVFVGAKMLASDLYKVNTWVSLGVITAIIGTSVWASLRRKNDPAAAEDPTGAGGTAGPTGPPGGRGGLFARL
jgi:tellurite resistance protein TerC